MTRRRLSLPQTQSPQLWTKTINQSNTQHTYMHSIILFAINVLAGPSYIDRQQNNSPNMETHFTTTLADSGVCMKEDNRNENNHEQNTKYTQKGQSVTKTIRIPEAYERIMPKRRKTADSSGNNQTQRISKRYK
jgi:hypothetical protein